MTSDSIFAGLAPSLVWAEFEQILSIPRPSKHEQLIREYLLSFASRHSLASRVDAKGNVVISKGATLGFEDRPVVVLQNHMDMVCEKNSDVSHDFMVDPISAYVDGGWVRARGTTLGADCGIGMAMALAVLRDDSVSHPSLEALFTVDEEQGLSGAFELDPSIISGRYLINLDSEDDGEIYIGCAGGVDTFGRFPLVYSRGEGSLIEVSVSGLLGGHSGDDIDKGRGCSLKILGWILQSVLDLVSDARLVSIEGGNLRNAIAREASASLVVPSCWVSRVLDLVARLSSSYSSLFSRVEPELRVSCLDLGAFSGEVFDLDSTLGVVGVLHCLPHGVLDMSREILGLVETSTNLASIRVFDGVVEVVTSQRSSDYNSKMSAARGIALIFSRFGFVVSHSDGYPGWRPDRSSALLGLAEAAYIKIFSKPPLVKAIHAGLECGLIIEKCPGMEAISIGPTMRGVHSPLECVEIEAVERCYRFLVGILGM